jgi:AcrR family transcriptional regulator
VTRTVDLVRRAEILDRITSYVMEHGFAELSLRPLARAVALSPRALLYHFGSKEEIVTAVLDRIRQRQLAMFERLRRSKLSTPGAICRAAWTYMTMPDVMPMLRLFFETYAAALREPKRFPGFLDRAIEDWLTFLGDPLIRAGVARKRARTVATVVLAGYRGFMLDFAATGDGERIGRAVEAWGKALETLMPSKAGKGRKYAEEA